MAKRSKTVAEKVAELYALMAAIAAQRAISNAKEAPNTIQAEYWAEVTGKWLDKSSADAARWTYRAPPS